MAKKAAPKKPMKADSKPPKSEAKPLAPKKHERVAKPSEAELLEKGRKLASSYLTQRDGMPEELADMVIASMDADAVNALITEANTAVMSKAPMPNPEPDPAEIIPDFLTIPALANHEEFAALSNEMIAAAKRKNESEKEYKDKKAKVIAIMDAARTKKTMFLGYTLSRYQGKNVMLNAQLLIEAGVDPETVNKCYKDSPFEDVRITPPSAPKVG